MLVKALSRLVLCLVSSCYVFMLDTFHFFFLFFFPCLFLDVSQSITANLKSLSLTTLSIFLPNIYLSLSEVTTSFAPLLPFYASPHIHPSPYIMFLFFIGKIASARMHSLPTHLSHLFPIPCSLHRLRTPLPSLSSPFTVVFVLTFDSPTNRTAHQHRKLQIKSDRSFPPSMLQMFGKCLLGDGSLLM